MSNRPQKKKNMDTYKTYIYSVLKMVHPQKGIGEKSMSIMNDLIAHIFVELKKEALKLMHLSKKKTLSSREIMFATRLVLPGELAKHAVSEGTKAVTKYNSNDSRQKMSRAERAGLKFGVGRIRRHLKANAKANVGEGAPVFLAAVLEYMAAELLELAGNAANDQKRTRITPRNIRTAIGSDAELNKLFHKIVVAEGGVMPHIHATLLPKTKKSRSSAAAAREASPEFGGGNVFQGWF